MGRKGRGLLGPRKDEDSKDKNKNKSTRESANAAAEESPEDESWAVMHVMDHGGRDASDEGESYRTQ